MGITEILTLAVTILILVILVLVFIYWYIGRQEKQGNDKRKNEVNDEKPQKTSSTYSKLSVFDFMEFDTIKDSMIVQNNGSRYLMVIECEGINYDLMSEVEKAAVEQGFIEFLNTLRHPIQLYIQTRTINISNSIENYNIQLEQVRQKLIAKQNEYNKALQLDSNNQKYLNNLRLEIARNQNLYDYGQDIISNTEKMSLNKNVLRKHYYIILPYYTAELGVEIEDEEEKLNMVFSELFTRAQTLIRTLFACSMKGRVLDSSELIDLLYVAYNRDEAEVFGIDKAVKAGYTELYSTAPDVLDKKMEAINKLVEEKALEKAKEAVEAAKSEKEKKVAEKEKNMDKLILEAAQIIINENKQYIGEDVAKEAIAKINNTKEEVKDNAKKQTKTRRKSTK